MMVINLFSKRQKKLRGEMPDIYTYDKLPQGLKNQILHIINDTVGKNEYNEHSNQIYDFAYKVIVREHKQIELPTYIYNKDHRIAILNYFLSNNLDTELAIDIIEVFFKLIDTTIREEFNYSSLASTTLGPDDAIDELNVRFRENGVGYAFEGGQIVRIDSTFMHSEVLRPTLHLIKHKKFSSVNLEYLNAHEHYRHKRYSECINESLKAFESTMKVICHFKNWNFTENDGASKLIKICLDNRLIPQNMQTQFNSLKSLLESGVPTIRNNLSGHGSGVDEKNISPEWARYALNLTGSNIIFLIECSQFYFPTS